MVVQDYGRRHSHDDEADMEKALLSAVYRPRSNSDSSSSTATTASCGGTNRQPWTRWRIVRTVTAVLLATAMLVIGHIALEYRAKQHALEAIRAGERTNNSTSLPTHLRPPYILSSTTPLSAMYQNLSKTVLDLPAFPPAPLCQIDADRVGRYSRLLNDVRTQETMNSSSDGRRQNKILLAANLYNNEQLIPTLIQEIPQLASFLGNERLHVSIYESGSGDATPQLLLLLARTLESLDIAYDITARGLSVAHGIVPPDVPVYVPHTSKAWMRVPFLAALRNKVLAPIFPSTAVEPAAASATDVEARVLSHVGTSEFSDVVFMNDVFFCASSVLELLYQQRLQSAHLSCGTDWFSAYPRSMVTGLELYDTWVARLMNGLYLSTALTFGRLAALHPPSRERYLHNLPFQAFSCWNGIIAIDARAFTERGIAFRSLGDSDDASESYLISVDLWKKGMGKIQIVPQVKVAYTLDDFQTAQHEMQGRLRAQKAFGTVEAEEEHRIKWVATPPPYVEFYPNNFGKNLFNEDQFVLWDGV